MPLLDEEQKGQLKEIFQGLAEAVEIIFFTAEEGCEDCKIMEDLMSDILPLTDKIGLEILEFGKEPERAAEYGVDKVPAIVVKGERDYGIRFYGVPAGHEFTAFVQDLLYVGNRNPELSDKILKELERIDRPVHLQVMTTLACPYCPLAVKAAHRLAMANDNIIADMIGTAEFPDLTEKYNVHGVPDTIINEDHRVVGAIPELELVYFIQEALGIELSEQGKEAIEAARTQTQAPAEGHEHHDD